MSRPVLKVGYLPLVDAAPLVIAQELGFASEEGISLNLLRQPSWSALRDLLAVGHLDVAHLLYPLPLAINLGLCSLRVEIDALMTLSINGNAIGVSNQVAHTMRCQGWDGQFETPAETGRALIKATGTPRIGIPFSHSMHAELVGYWLEALGLPGAHMQTVPPPLMTKAVEEGVIDAFCVGEPWGSQTVEEGAGELILPSAAIWANAPEKVLGARRPWVEENLDEVRALLRAVWRAGLWLTRPENLTLASDILARSEYLNRPDSLIDRALRGEICQRAGGAVRKVPSFLRFQSAASPLLVRSQTEWLAGRLADRHGLEPNRATATAHRTYQMDTFAEALLDAFPTYQAASYLSAEHDDTIGSFGPDRLFNG